MNAAIKGTEILIGRIKGTEILIGRIKGTEILNGRIKGTEILNGPIHDAQHAIARRDVSDAELFLSIFASGRLDDG